MSYIVCCVLWFPVKEYEDVSPPSVAKIPKSYVPSVAMPTMSVPEGLASTSYSYQQKQKWSPFMHNDILHFLKFESSWLTGAEKKNEKFDEDNQQNIRASSIPRPRAVLSSPGNFTLQKLCFHFLFLSISR